MKEQHLKFALLATVGLALLAMVSNPVSGQESTWEVPDEAKAMESPLEVTGDVIADGRRSTNGAA